MTFNEYQSRAHEFAGPSCDDFFYPLLGLGGETGELLDKFKKQWRDKGIRSIGGVSMADGVTIARELGDVLWYIGEIAYRLGYNLHHVAEMNIAKLEDRAARGKIGGEGDSR